MKRSRDLFSLDPEDGLERESGGRWSGPEYRALGRQLAEPFLAPSCEARESSPHLLRPLVSTASHPASILTEKSVTS